MATFNSATANHWQAYGDYSVTAGDTQYTFSLNGYMRAISWGFQLTGVSVSARVGDNSTTVSANLSTAYAGTGNSTPAAHPSNYTIKRTHAAQSVLLRVYVSNQTGYMSGTATAETTYTVPALASYTVAFNANGGSGAPGNQTKWYGESLTLSTTKPTRATTTDATYTVTYNYNGSGASNTTATAKKTTSYAFSKWNTAANGSGTNYNSGASYTANSGTTLYAQWTSTTKTASVTLPTPTRTGYTFAGWYDAATGGSKVGNGGASYTPTANKTLYAHWTINTYAVAYNANGGSGAPGSQTKTYGTNLTLSSTKPTRSGYRFDGWATSASGSVTYQPGGTYSANAAVTLYAKWTQYWTVAYNANGGSGAPASQTKYSGTALTLSTARPTRTNYNFKGWATSSTGAVAYQPGGSYTANAAATLYAVWELAYKKPTVGTAEAHRVTDATGEEADVLGTYAKASFGWSVGTGGTSAKSVAIQYQQSGGSWTSATPGGAGTGDASGTTTAVFPADESKTYNVRLTVTDQTGGSTSRTVTVGSAQVPIDVGKKGRAVGILAKAGDEGTLTVGGKVVMGDQLLSNAGGGTFNVAHVFGGNNNGHAVSYGGGASTIVGAGESWKTVEGIIADPTGEQLHLAADKDVVIYANVDAATGTWYRFMMTIYGNIRLDQSTDAGATWDVVTYFARRDQPGPFTAPLAMNGTYVTAKSENLTSGTVPSANTNGRGFVMQDLANNAYLGSLHPKFLTDGRQGVELYAVRVVNGSNVYNALDLYIDASGNRTVTVSDAAAWRNGIAAAPSAATKSSAASQIAMTSGRTLASIYTAKAGAVLTVIITFSSTSAMTANTTYDVGTLISGLRPYGAGFNAKAGNAGDRAWITTGGVVRYAPGAARAANTSLNISATYVVA